MKRYLFTFWVCLLSVFIVMMQPTGALGFGLLFDAAVSFDVGITPRSVTSGDFDGDGDIDLAVPNYGSNDVSILLGNGDGIFVPAVNYSTGDYPISVTSSDFDGDGDIDLAVANQLSDDVSILSGNGDGTFAPAMNYGAGDEPSSVTSSDFDGDGDIDLAVTSHVSDIVSILLGHGDGTFAPAVNYSVGVDPRSITSSDFDGDGDSDLAVGNYETSNVSILLGNGDGTFGSAVNYGVGAFPLSVIGNDFDGDGDIDLATANSSSDNVSILLGNGDGTFSSEVNYSVGESPRSVTGSDFDGDGDIDLAVANVGRYPDKERIISILLGHGDGTFASAVHYLANDEPASVISSDFDGDGDIDLAVANKGSRNVSIHLGHGDGTFASAVRYGAGDDPSSVSSSDFDGDGDIDLAVANGNSDDVSILLGNGDGTFASAVNYAAADYPMSLTTSDFDGDGDSDLAVANRDSANVSILLGNGDGTFASAVNYDAGDYPMSLTTSDFDGDGDSDLAVANSFSGNVSILLGNGDGTFAPAINYDAGVLPYSVISSDFDGDGDSDLAVANRNSDNVSILLGNGDGTFASAVHYTVGDWPQSVASSDFDGDGDSDLAVANNVSDNISILLGNGDGSFAPAVTYSTGDGPVSVTSSDFDGDGDSDLAVANAGSSAYYRFRNVSILSGNGDGTFASAANYIAADDPRSIITSDFDGDGDSDLAVADFKWDNVSILFNLFDGPPGLVFNTNDSGAGSLRWAIVGANASVDASVISFSIDGEGPHTIQLLTPLPAITAPVIIDGYTQPGASANTNGDGLGGNAVLMIELDGSLLGGGTDYGLQISDDYCTIRGLVINNFPSNGIRLDSNENVVEGNYIGINVDGTTALPNSVGIYVAGDNNRIGGADPAARNVVSGNENSGIVIFNSGFNYIRGNFIGVATSGTSGLPNQADGVFLSGSDYNHIFNNLISANLSCGVSAPTGTSIIGNWIRSNYIGTDVTGTTALGNGVHGVYLLDGVGFGPENRVGGAPLNSNVIANNGGDGVNIALPATGVPAIVSHNTIHNNDNGVVVTSGNAIISQNQTYSNAGLGIDLADDGVTANDTNDPDSGPNGLQNYPVLTAVVPGSITINGTFNSTPSTDFIIEFFSSAACDPSGYGEGGTYLGEMPITTTLSGDASFITTLAANVPGGHYITATARPQEGGGTSEFSKCIQFINTPTGLSVSVTPVDEATGETPVVLTFDEVTVAGNTTLEITDTGPAVPGTFIVGDPATYSNLSTTAAYNDSILVCFSYDEAEIPGAEEDLVILHYDTTLVPPDWEDITAYVNTLLNEVCGRTATLSPFVLAVPSSATGVDPTPEAPARYALYQNVPNPFNPTTTIRFDLPARSHVKLAVYNVKGQLIRVLIDRYIDAGYEEVRWDGRDSRGRGVASGIYFYRLDAPTFSESRKMILLR